MDAFSELDFEELPLLGWSTWEISNIVNHACVHHNDTTTFNAACWGTTFCRHLPTRQKGGKHVFESSPQSRVKVSTNEARGSHQWACVRTFVIALTVDVLSETTRTCWSWQSMRRDLTRSSTSSTFNVVRCLSFDHKPCVQAVLEAIPQPLNEEASEGRVTYVLHDDVSIHGWEWHQFKSPMLFC